jgi:hypothetical protein
MGISSTTWSLDRVSLAISFLVRVWVCIATGTGRSFPRLLEVDIKALGSVSEPQAE